MNLGEFREATKDLPNETTLETADGMPVVIVTSQCSCCGDYMVIITDEEDTDGSDTGVQEQV